MVGVPVMAPVELLIERPAGRPVADHEAMVAVDDTAIDGTVSGMTAGVRRVSDALRGLQTGYARSYALSMLAGAGLFAGAVLIAATWR